MTLAKDLSEHADADGAPLLARRRGMGKSLTYVVRHYPIGLVGAVIVFLVILVAVLASALAPFDPARQIAGKLVPPGGQYILGTDEFGRDVLSRIIYGSRISLYVGIISVLVLALPVGGGIGVLAGYYGGWVDNLIMRLVDIMFSFPTIVLAIAIVAVLGPNLTNAMVAIGIVYMPTFARVARGPTLTVVNLDYVGAARALGARDAQIIFRHVLPNIAAPVIVQTTVALSTAILAEASLSFLGLGTQPPDPSWGTMLGTGRKYMELSPWVAVFPGLAIMVAVLGFNLAGDGLRDALDPRLKET